MFYSFLRPAMVVMLLIISSVLTPAQAFVLSSFGFSGAKAFTRAIIAEDLTNGLSPMIETECLTIGLYHEARGEPRIGQIAVAETILNRVRSSVYPNTICGVVFQNSHKLNACQFSFACDDLSDQMRTDKIADQLRQIAKAMIADFKDDQNRSTFFEQRAPFMTHYHRYDVHPSWSNDLEILAQIGNHIFFRSERVVRTYPVDQLVTASLTKLPAINASNDIGL